MKKLEPQSIDMVLADLPYGTTACKWDTVIPFEPLWEQLNRVSKPNAAMVMFGSEPFSTALRSSNLKRFKYDWVWRKNRPMGFLQANFRPLKAHEMISVFSDGSATPKAKNPMAYNPQGLVVTNRTKVRRPGMGIGSDRESQLGEYVSKGTNYPRSVLDFSLDTSTVHPTQKPTALLEYLIKTYTNEGDTVLDPTMGSGSTGVACRNLGRKFVGIERDEKYIAIAVQRIAQTHQQMHM